MSLIVFLSEPFRNENVFDITTFNLIVLSKSSAFFKAINFIVFTSFSSANKLYYNLLSTIYLAEFLREDIGSDILYLSNILKASSIKV